MFAAAERTFTLSHLWHICATSHLYSMKIQLQLLFSTPQAACVKTAGKCIKSEPVMVKSSHHANKGWINRQWGNRCLNVSTYNVLWSMQGKLRTAKAGRTNTHHMTTPIGCVYGQKDYKLLVLSKKVPGTKMFMGPIVCLYFDHKVEEPCRLCKTG